MYIATSTLRMKNDFKEKIVFILKALYHLFIMYLSNVLSVSSSSAGEIV